MSDLISRQAAIDTLADMHCKSDEDGYIWIIRSDAWARIDALPSVQPEPSEVARDIATIIENEKDMRVIASEPRWIPCSERLPEERDWYLGVFREPDTGWINPLPFICDYIGKETKATTKECWLIKGYTDREEYIYYYFNLECIAWMPLPEPYKGGNRNEAD